jgi:hypothetical protein
VSREHFRHHFTRFGACQGLAVVGDAMEGVENHALQILRLEQLRRFYRNTVQNPAILENANVRALMR